MKKMKAENLEMDRFSSLPDHIIHHILSSMDTKYAVQTCVLSKAWKHRWTQIHSLDFDDRLFLHKTVSSFTWYFKKFVRHVFDYRKPYHLRRLKLRCNCGSLINEIFEYADLHKVEELETTICNEPFESFYKCQTLRTLKVGPPCDGRSLIPIASRSPTPFRIRSLDPFGFASLTTLQLFRVCLAHDNYNDDLLLNLKNCRIVARATLNISSTQLVNLHMAKCRMQCIKIFNIHASRLLNLTISDLRYDFSGQKKNGELLISAPRLEVFDFEGMYPQKCPTLDKVNILMYPSIDCQKTSNWKEECNSYMLRMAEELSYVKSLTVSVKLSKKESKSYGRTKLWKAQEGSLWDID